MSRVLYQSKFCAECGTRQERRSWWKHGYFCDHCAPQLGRRRYWWAMSLVLCGLLGGLTISTGRETALNRITALNTITAPVVSAQDATALLKPAPLASAQPQKSFTCGARTKKGTPCKRRVKQAGLRCAQHQGKPSLLKY